MQMCVAQGTLLHIQGDFHVAPEVERHWRDQIRARATSGAGLTVSEIRDILSTSRKFALPLCEYWDREGFTRRAGDLRHLVES